MDFSAIKSFKIRPLADKALNIIKTNRLAVKLISFLFVGIISVLITVSAVGITVGFDVDYSGKIIATVRDASVFASAKNIAAGRIGGHVDESEIPEPKFLLTLTVADRFSGPEKLASAIIKNTDNITEGFALVVNGEILLCTDEDNLWQLLEERRSAFFVEGAENAAEFTDDIEVESGYYLSKDIKEDYEIREIIDGLDVKTVSVSISDTDIPFTTKTVKSSKYEVDYHKVSQEGKNGLSQTTVVTETLNGVKTCEDTVTTQIISEPVEQVEVIGTASHKISASQHAKVVSAGFILPLNSGEFKISSYYGDGRNHKGMDLSADKGTAIFAVADGVVETAGYHKDFGYNVVINHGNGLKTRYAHASALCVSAGDKVSQGDMIAAVGSTGYSLGNHLHFEVIVNGNRVNPAPYIGL